MFVKAPIEESCFWLATRRDQDRCPPLSGDEKTEIAVVGAGFTGLWTAHFLKQLKPDLDVCVIEQGATGYGASGRNAGIISSSIDHSHALAIAHFGREEAARLAKIGLANIDELAEFAHDCDFEQSGQLCMALTPGHIEECKRNIEVAEELNLPGYRYLCQEETRSEIDSPLYLGSFFSPGGGVINPVKLVEKLKREAIAGGVRFFEGTRVKEVENLPGGQVGARVKADGGMLCASRVVLATDAYTHHLFPQLLWRFIPLYDYIIVSEPLSQSEHDSIGWKNRQGVTDGRTFFNYYRMTADNRILWGTSEAMYYPPNRVDESCDHSDKHYQDLHESFKRHFPQLAHLKFPYAWGGPIASTTRLTPFFGTIDGANIIYALGYTGHGIGTTRLAGKILASMALAQDSDLLSLSMVKNKPFPYPPEPIRSLSVKMVTSSLRQVDEGKSPNLLLQVLDVFGIGFSS